MSDLIGALADTSEHDLDDLARLTAHHYDQLTGRGLPVDLAAQLARDLHSTWLAAIYGESILLGDRLLATAVGKQSAFQDDVLALRQQPTLFESAKAL